MHGVTFELDADGISNVLHALRLAYQEFKVLFTILPCRVILFFAKCFRDGSLPIKINYDDQNVEIWRHNVQCHELTFLRATRDATSHAQT